MRILHGLPRTLALLLVALFVCGTVPAAAYTPDEVSQLVAPVALYPDALLSNVLAAAAYPDEVAQAQQWVQQYGALQPSQVDSTLASVNWDPSIKSLTAFPDVLNYMAANMAWTQALGNAFLTQPDDVQGAIQNLRLAAQENGALQSTAQVVVSDQSGAVVIEAADPGYLYVPEYDFNTVYYQGWSPIMWGPGIDCGQYLWLGCFDWRYHHMYFGQGYNYYYRGNLPSTNPYYQHIYGNVSRRQGAWQFNPAHRLGRPVPTISQLGQGRGFAVPGNGFSPGARNPGPMVRPATPGFNLPRTAAPSVNLPSLYNVRPGSNVNIERSQGAQSRSLNMPSPVRPMAPSNMSRPSFQRSVPMPRQQQFQRQPQAPRQQSAPRQQPQRGGGRR